VAGVAAGAARRMIPLDAVLARIPEWRGRALEAEPLAGGMTNRNYRVRVDGRAYVVRIPGADTAVLGIDRRNEHHNTCAAAAAGVGPRVVHYLPDLDVMVTEFLEGRALTAADLQAPGMPARVAALLRELHAAPRFLHDVDMFDLVDRYLAVAAARGIPLLADYRRRLPALRAIHARLAAAAGPRVPCHNDLLPENYIDDGRRLRAVDYEYSGNGDPAFDLGNTCLELGYDAPRVEALAAAYFGRPAESALARVRLHMIVSDAVWALWAVVQSRISRLELDYWRYGLDRWTRAQAGLDAPVLREWLAALDAPRSPA